MCLEWTLADPSQVQGSPEEVHAAYEAAYEYLRKQISDLASAIAGDKSG